MNSSPQRPIIPHMCLPPSLNPSSVRQKLLFFHIHHRLHYFIQTSTPPDHQLHHLDPSIICTTSTKLFLIRRQAPPEAPQMTRMALLEMLVHSHLRAQTLIVKLPHCHYMNCLLLPRMPVNQLPILLASPTTTPQALSHHLKSEPKYKAPH